MVTLQEIREQHQKLISEKEGGGGGGTSQNDWAKFEPGSNIIRFLPGKESPLNFYVEGAIHRIEGPDGKNKNFQCRRPQNEECPICEFYFDLWKRHKALNLDKGVHSKFGDLATGLKQKARYYALAVIRALQAKGEDPVKYIAMSSELYTRVIAAVANPYLCDPDDETNTTIISTDKGNDFNVVLGKKDKFNTFANSEAIPRKSKAGTPAEIAAWMETKLNLATLIKIGDYEEGKKIVAQLEATLNTVSQVNKPATTQKPADENNEVKFQKELKV